MGINNKLHNLFFILCAAVWLTLFIIPDFLNYPIGDVYDLIRLIFFNIGLQAFSIFLLLCALNGNKYVFAVCFPLLSLLGCIVAFYRYAYKAILTPMLIDVALHTDLGTSLDVIPVSLLLFAIVALMVSFLFVWYRFKRLTPIRPVLYSVISLLLLLSMFGFYPACRDFMRQHFPYSISHTLIQYHQLQTKIAKERIDPDPTLQSSQNDSLVVVFILGESLRADHLSLNGYHRTTTPNLDRRDNIVSLPNVYSLYAYTGASVAHILTRADTAHVDRANTEISFIRLFNKCNFNSYWIANQEKEEHYASFMEECDTLIFAHPERNYLGYDLLLDGDLLPHFETILRESVPRKLIILHTIGSHWYYNAHFPDSMSYFMPITTNKIVQRCSPEEMINSYDNTIRYTDWFIDQLLTQLEQKNAIVIYLSDHGEALGENGRWLHANDIVEARNSACFVWYSEIYGKNNAEKITALQHNKDKYYVSDFLYHSILSAANIPTSLIVPELDIFTVVGP